MLKLLCIYYNKFAYPAHISQYDSHIEVCQKNIIPRY